MRLFTKIFYQIMMISLISACGTSEPDFLAQQQIEKVKSYADKKLADVARYSDSTHGNWRYVNDVTKTTMEVDSYAWTSSTVGRNRFGQSLTLGVSCVGSYQNELVFNVYVRVDQVTESIDAYRFNDAKPIIYPDQYDWDGYDGITIHGDDSRSFITQALTKNYVYFDMDMYAEPNIEAKFSLKGFNAAFDKVYRDCWISENS